MRETHTQTKLRHCLACSALTCSSWYCNHFSTWVDMKFEVLCSSSVYSVLVCPLLSGFVPPLFTNVYLEPTRFTRRLLGLGIPNRGGKTEYTRKRSSDESNDEIGRRQDHCVTVCYSVSFHCLRQVCRFVKRRSYSRRRSSGNLTLQGTRAVTAIV